MSAVMETVPWEDVGVGDLVIGRDGHEWEVLERAEATTLRRVHDGTTFTTTPTGTVVRAVAAAQVAERAVAVAQVVLGGEAVARGPGEGGYECPEAYVDAGSLGAHLYLFHGVTEWEGLETYAALSARHDGLHAEQPPAKGYVSHRHVAGFYEKESA